MSKNNRNILIGGVVVLVFVAIIAIVGWLKYTATSNDLSKSKANHAKACEVIAAQDDKIATLNHELYPTGTSVTLDRGSVNEHSAGCTN